LCILCCKIWWDIFLWETLVRYNVIRRILSGSFISIFIKLLSSCFHYDYITSFKNDKLILKILNHIF
jgi:hypothetical protein